MLEHKRLFKNQLSVNRSSIKISYRNNNFNNDCNNFNIFLKFFNSSGDFKVCLIAPISEILFHVLVSNWTLNENQLTAFSMVRVFTERSFQADFHFSFNVNDNVTVTSYMNSSSCEMKLHNFL